jgi:5'(3')-deoxyribonucleotidase
MNKPIIYLDLDGVLVDFVSGALKTLGVTNYKIPPNGYKIESWKGVGVSTKEFWKAIDATNEHFWADLEKYPWSDKLVRLCESYGSVFILTSPSRNPYCLAGKMMWLKKHYPRLTRSVIMTPHKYLCAAPNRILIDDNDDKINKFIEYGGTGILFPQMWNTAHALNGLDKVEYVETYLDRNQINGLPL